MDKEKVYAEIICNLLKNRDFLCQQLSAEYGVISEEELNRIADDYFSKQLHTDDGTLMDKVVVLAELIGPESVDSDIISVCFNTDIPLAMGGLGGPVKTNGVGSFFSVGGFHVDPKEPYRPALTEDDRLLDRSGRDGRRGSLFQQIGPDGIGPPGPDGHPQRGPFPRI